MSAADDLRSVPLGRAVVLRAAPEIVDRGGAAGLSMRRPDAAPALRGRYAANKDALLGGGVEGSR